MLGTSVCSGELKETCFGVGWLSCVMVSMTDVNASFGTLNSIVLGILMLDMKVDFGVRSCLWKGRSI